jgi:hypothetical protein
MPLVNDDGSPFNPLAPVGKPEGLIVTRDQWSPPIREGGPPQSDAMGQRGTPSFMDTLGASFRLENEVVGAVRAMGEERDFGDEDPDHNPWDTIKETKYQDYWQAFTASRNPAETEHIRSKIDAELEDRRIREASGATGFLTDMVASLASPTVLLPGGAIYRGFRVGSAVARSAASVGALAAASVTAQELMLQSQQYTRTWTESMLNIGGGTVLGGLLGGGVSFFSSRALARAARQIDDDIVRIRSDVDTQPTGAAQAAGAAPSRVVQENVPEGAFGLEKAFSWQGPLTRVLASEIRAARDVMTRLAEVPFRLRQNREGIATGPAGGSVEGRIKIDGDVAIYRASEALHKAFAEYRFGNADAKFAKSKAAFGDMVKPDQGRLGWKQFKQEITAALRAETSKGIEHPIPQVKAAAEAFRKEVFEPFKKEAQKLGLFPEDAEFSFNYVMRRYDINAILNNYERFRGILVEHLKGGQAKARAELAAVEREIAASRGEGDMTGEVDALAKQFEAERARVQEARSAQANVKSSIDEDAAYLDELTRAKADTPEGKAALDSERLDVETRIADEKAAERRIRAFHGSPHEFDKFTMEAIGSGEGAQAFGHGLYFAESDRVGKFYQEKLGNTENTLNGEPIPLDMRGPNGERIGEAVEFLQAGSSYAETRRMLRIGAESMPEDWPLVPATPARMKAHEDSYLNTIPLVDQWEREGAKFGKKTDAHFYEVRINAEPDQFLDLDASYQQQSPHVLAVLKKLGITERMLERDGRGWLEAIDANLTSGWIRGEKPFDSKRVSEALRKAGLAGVRYLDATSRANGDGTRNIVLFDDSLVEIVSRNGVPVKPQEQAAVKEKMSAPQAEPQAEAPRIELDPAVISAVEGLGARLGIQMPDLRTLDIDGMMDAIARSIGEMTGMAKGTGTADIKALQAKADELRFIADADDAELSQIAADTISKITGSPAARGINPYDAAFLQGPSGPLHARTLKIPDEKIVDFLDDDIERIALQYVRSMAPDVALTREFGDLNLTEDLKRIEEEAQKLMAANPERAAEIDAQSKRAQKDLQAVVARLRGTYNLAHDPTSFGPRAASAVKQANVLRLMGSVLAASISDVPRLLFTHGFRQNADLFSTLITNLEGLKMAKAEAKELSAGLEFVLSRSGQLWDAFDDMVGHTVGERALRVMTNKFGRLTLMDQWNATWKQLSGIMTMNRVLRHSVDLMNGKLNPKDLGKLAASGIDEAVAERIAAQYQKHGTVYGRLFLANANDWDDPLARQALQAAVRREADITVVTPGQERPLWTSGTYGSVVGQFRTFQLISVQRTLIAGLQEMDAAKVSAMAMMISLGMLSEQLKMIIHGKEKKNQPKDMGDWMYVGLANSGILGWLSDADQMAHKVTRGNISVGKFAFGREAPTSRFASQNAIGALAGPSAGAFADVVQAIGAASSGDIRESDVHAVRRLLPYQNLFYLSRSLRAFEDGMIDAFGIPRTQRRN